MGRRRWPADREGNNDRNGLENKVKEDQRHGSKGSDQCPRTNTLWTTVKGHGPETKGQGKVTFE